jgi:HK97 family phage portal protein
LSKQSALARAWQSVRSMWLGSYNIKDPLSGFMPSQKSLSGVTVNEQTALNYSAVWAAIQCISGDVGSIPLVLYRRVDGGKEPMREHPLYRLLHDQPNPEMTAVVFRETLQAHVLSWGGGFAEIEWRGDGRPQYLWPITPDRVTPERDAGGRLYYKVTNYNKPDSLIAPENMLHIPGLGFDGTCGYSVVKMARESIGLGLATEKFGSAWFGNGASFGGIVTHPASLRSPEARKNVRESIQALHGGVGRNNRIALFEEGMTYTPTSVPPDDSQFLETRKFQITEIARWFQIPPHMLADLERATFSNIEQQAIDYYMRTLRRWLVRWEQEVNRKLVLQNGTQFVQHVIEDFLRGDIESRYAAYAVGRQWGWLSANMVLAKENMNTIGPAGDIFLVPINMAPADKINELVDSQIKSNAAPTVAPGGERSEDVDTILEALTRHEAAIRATVERMQDTFSPEAQQALREQLDRLTVERDDFVRELAAARDVASRAQTKTELVQRSEANLRAEWIAAQEKHRERIEADLTERTRLQAELTRQAEIVTALEGEVAARTQDLDQARDAHAQAVRVAEEAREAERAALSDKVVSAAEATAAKEAAELAETRAAAAGLLVSARAEQVGAVTAERDAAVDAFADVNSRLADAYTEIGIKDKANAERLEVLLKLEADLQVAQAEIDREKQRADAAQAQATAAEERAATAEQSVLETRKAEAARLSLVLGSHRALIAAEVGRMARRQAEKARRYQATPEKLRRWLETFASVEQPICVEALLPAVRTHLAWMQSTEDAATVTTALVAANLSLFDTRLRAVCDSNDEDFHATLEAVLQRWEADRPTEVADAILQEGIAYVRAR